MNDFYTTLPNTMRQLKQIEAELEIALAKLRGLKTRLPSKSLNWKHGALPAT